MSSSQILHSKSQILQAKKSQYYFDSQQIANQMNDCLLKMLVFMTLLQMISTVINVVHKLKLINGPNAHVAIAILSMIVLFGYSGILNTLFLRRKFLLGRILYMILAMGSQTAILVLSILAWTGVMSYFDAIAIIHALVGFITIINFACAVMVVDQQHKEILEEDEEKLLEKLKKKYAVIHQVGGKNLRARSDDPLLDSYHFKDLLPLSSKENGKSPIVPDSVQMDSISSNSHRDTRSMKTVEADVY